MIYILTIDFIKLFNSNKNGHLKKAFNKLYQNKIQKLRIFLQIIILFLRSKCD